MKKMKPLKKVEDYRELNTQLPPLRVTKTVKEELEKEAKDRGHNLSGYIRWLIERGRKNLKG